MLDINKIRENPEQVKKALSKRMPKNEINLEELIKLDDERKALIKESESLKAEKKKYSKTKPSAEIIKEMKIAGDKIKSLDQKINAVEYELCDKISTLPNIPADDVVAGGKENNKVIYTFGKKPEFGFTPKSHMELSEELGLIDYKRGVKMSGAGFWVYTGKGALLEWALLNYFIDTHVSNCYDFILAPYLLTEESAYTSGHLPKFKNDLYWTHDKLCLNATSEMMLGNYHRDEIINADKLPLKYFSYSACFRREAGTYGSDERGMVRGHQFNKIEMFQFTEPGKSWNAFEELRAIAEKLVEGLGLHFQTTQLSAGDTSAAMAKTVDIEVYLPSMKGYKEVSSVSNALDYQARRGNVRYRAGGKNEYVHTLNGSGLATSRLLPAILEQCQKKDGTVEIPEILRKYMNGFKELKRNA